MQIETFELERTQSLWENDVEFNLTESGVHPYTLRELLNERELDELCDLRLGYGWTNGEPELREAIAELYPGATTDHVLVTNGSAEANFVAMWSLLEPGDEIALMLPNYMQIWGIARSQGVEVRPFHLREEKRWAPDLDELRSCVNERTKAIVLCNPNNPTGAVLSDEDARAIVELARENDAWLYVDEVYRGVELDGRERPSFFGTYERVIVASGLSKALAHPGLRIGWLCGPPDVIAEAWSRTDYTTITTSVLSQRVVRSVLARREEILSRNRALLNQNVQVLVEWFAKRPELFRFVPPAAGGMAFVHYALDVNSTELATRLREDKSVFVVSGDCYGMDHYLRIGIGTESDYFTAGLEQIDAALREMGA